MNRSIALDGAPALLGAAALSGAALPLPGTGGSHSTGCVAVGHRGAADLPRSAAEIDGPIASEGAAALSDAAALSGAALPVLGTGGSPTTGDGDGLPVLQRRATDLPRSTGEINGPIASEGAAALSDAAALSGAASPAPGTGGSTSTGDGMAGAVEGLIWLWCGFWILGAESMVPLNT